MVLVAGKATSSPEWVSFCIRQADRIVMFSHVETPPERVPIDDSLEGHDLALFGAERTDAQVAAWLDTTKPLSHFHLREGETFQDDIARMCRRLVSASVGVAGGWIMARKKFSSSPSKRSKPDSRPSPESL